MMYLVVECTELSDQFECDANREPICLTEDYAKYNRMGYEIYKVNEDNTFTLIRNYDDVTKKEIVVTYWEEINTEDEDDLIEKKVISIKKGNRNDVTKSLIKNIKKKYHLSETIDNIYLEIQNTGAYGEEIGHHQYISIGEKYDNYISRWY